MLARKKCKYRPFGAKSRRKRRGLVKRICGPKTEPSKKKIIHKKPFDLPRQKPSDADTIKRMLANLPAKRATRKIISLKDGYVSRTKQIKSTKQAKFKCGKLIREKNKNQNAKSEYEKANKHQNNSYRRSLRCLNKILSSRILDTNSSLIVKRKYNHRKMKNDRKTKNEVPAEKTSKIGRKDDGGKTQFRTNKQLRNDFKSKRTSPRIEKRSEFGDKMGIKRFFPVKKKKNVNYGSGEILPETQSKCKKSVPDEEKEPITRKRKTGLPNAVSVTKKTKPNQPPTTVTTRKLSLRSMSGLGLETSETETPPLEKENEPVVEATEPVTFLPPSDCQPQNEVDPEKPEPCNTAPVVTQPPCPEQTKRKFKKPARGLNDCIAMLTSKLGHNLEQTSAINVFHEEEPSQQHPEVQNIVDKKTEYILKVPLSNEHFDLNVVKTVKTSDEQLKNDGSVDGPKRISYSWDEPKEIPFSGDGPKGTSYSDEVSKGTVFSDEGPKDTPCSDEGLASTRYSDEGLEGTRYSNEVPKGTLYNDDGSKGISCSGDELTEISAIGKTADVEESPLEENKPEAEESKPEVEESKQEAEESKQEAEESKPETEESKPEAEESKPEAEESKPEAEESKPEAGEILETEESKELTQLLDLVDPQYFDTNVNNEEPTRSQVREDKYAETDSEDEIPLSNLLKDDVDRTKLHTVEESPRPQSLQDILSSDNESIFGSSSDIATLNNQEVDSLSINNNNLDNRGDVTPLAPTDLTLDMVPCEEYTEKDSIYEPNTASDVDVSMWNNSETLSIPAPDVNSQPKLDILESNNEAQSDADKSRKRTKVAEPVIKHNAKENADSCKVNKSRKAARSAKTKAMESILDDALLELSENELLLQDNLNNLMQNDEKSKLVKKTLKKTIKSLACNSKEEDKTPSIENKEESVSVSNESRVMGIEDERADNEQVDSTCDSTQELRRSSRNSRRIASYNETDLVDPLLDDLENSKTISKIIKEATKDIFGIKRKSRKKAVKNMSDGNALNGNDLFDLLKSTPNENNVLSKPSNGFLTPFDEISNDFNDDNFEMFEDILEKSMAVIEENLSKSVTPTVDVAAVVEAEAKRIDSANVKKSSKSKSKHKNKVPRKQPEQTESNQENKTKIYCEICDKSFCRTESLNKHKRTLTHISKLSELEAKEAALKSSRVEEPNSESLSSVSKTELDTVNAGESCKEMSTLFDTTSVSNFQLSDIINDVLSKPEESVDDKQEPELRSTRCKSLAERKSFESENCMTMVNNYSQPTDDYFNHELPNAAAGTILEKQISLLENMIENRSGLSLIEDLSVSSAENCPQIPTYLQEKPEKDENFLKPSQYEENSDDSNLRSYDDQKSRKALNRDEELFLECCSLLKSGSEVSSYSKKSNHISKMQLNNEADWLERSYISQKANDDFIECYSDSSRIRTSLGDSFSRQDSNSVTSSSHWEMDNNFGQLDSKKDEMDEKDLSFEELLNNQHSQSLFFQKEQVEEMQTGDSSFDRAMSDVFTTDQSISKISDNLDLEFTSRTAYQNLDLKDDGKKILTKGAMKIFEGLKVSIPTEELNIDNILIGSNSTSSKEEKTRPKRSRHSKNKQKNRKKHDDQINYKTHDVYDFEETQDNSDVFTRPDFRTFRSEKTKKPETEADGSDDSRDCTNATLSSSTSSVSDMPSVKQNITKKKCMIMGRIFRNAVKSKITDEDIRNIPVVDNTKLVEDFVLSCPEPTSTEVKNHRMTEEEMNLAFDRLIGEGAKTQLQAKTNLKQRKPKAKSRKRNCGSVESSDDEFSLQKYSKKRHKSKNGNSEDSCINLEQELRECIGVASRKSQRKCTSGKQNILMEYWSSDESSSFEPAPEMSATQLVDRVDEMKPPQVVVMAPERKKPTCHRRKRVAADPLYHWSSSSEDESRDLIQVRPVRDELEDDDDRPIQHGWIVGDSPKKLVTMLAQAKGKKCDIESVKEYGKKRTFS